MSWVKNHNSMLHALGSDAWQSKNRHSVGKSGDSLEEAKLY